MYCQCWRKLMVRYQTKDKSKLGTKIGGKNQLIWLSSKCEWKETFLPTTWPLTGAQLLKHSDNGAYMWTRRSPLLISEVPISPPGLTSPTRAAVNSEDQTKPKRLDRSRPHEIEPRGRFWALSGRQSRTFTPPPFHVVLITNLPPSH